MVTPVILITHHHDTSIITWILIMRYLRRNMIFPNLPIPNHFREVNLSWILHSCVVPVVHVNANKNKLFNKLVSPRNKQRLTMLFMVFRFTFSTHASWLLKIYTSFYIVSISWARLTALWQTCVLNAFLYCSA